MTTKPKLACALVRVSSEEQARGGYGLEFQEQDIRTFCVRNNLKLLNLFRDEGYSGATAERPGFQELMNWAREKRFEVLVIWKLDRLFRDTKLTLQTVDELASLGIEVRSVQEAFTHDSNGRFLLTIFAAGAEKERRDIALRMQSGRVAAARNGVWVAAGRTAPFGYRYDAEKKSLVIDEEESTVVKEMFRWLVEEKLSTHKIQMRLNERRVPTKFDRIGWKKPTGSANWWARRTVGRILSNEVYQGTFTFRKYVRSGLAHIERNMRPKEDRVEMKSPAIISPSLFARAQAQLEENRMRSPRRTKDLYLLRGLLVCGHDHRRMHASKRTSALGRVCKYYFCHRTRGYVAAFPCPSRSISESRLVPPIWDKLKELMSDPQTVLKHIREYREQMIHPVDLKARWNALKGRRQQVLDRKERLIELYLAGSVGKDFYQAETSQLGLILRQMDSEEAQLRLSSVTDEQIAAKTLDVERIFEEYKAKLAEASDVVKRELLTLFIKSITVQGEELKIHFNLPPVPGARFEGQSAQRLSLKDDFQVVLNAKLVPTSQILRAIAIHENFSR